MLRRMDRRLTAIGAWVPQIGTASTITCMPLPESHMLPRSHKACLGLDSVCQLLPGTSSMQRSQAAFEIKMILNPGLTFARYLHLASSAAGSCGDWQTQNMLPAAEWLDWVEDFMVCWALSISYCPESGLCQLSLLHGQATEVGTLPASKGSGSATSNRWAGLMLSTSFSRSACCTVVSHLPLHEGGSA